MAFERRWQKPSIHHGLQTVPQPPHRRDRQLPLLQLSLHPLLHPLLHDDSQSSLLQRLNRPGRFHTQPVSDVTASSAVSPSVLQ